MTIKKDVFKMKLTGDFQLLMEYAFMHGYHGGFNTSSRSGISVPEDVDKLFKEFMEELNKNMKGNKPT